MSGTVMILMGSKNDWETLQETGRELDRLGLAWSAHVASAGGHRTSLWKPWLPVALTWLATVSPGFAPTARP